MRRGENSPLISRNMEQPAAEVRGSAALDATEPGAHDARREARVRYLALLACINSVSLGYQIGAVTVSNGLVKRHLNLSNAQLAAYEASVNIAAIAGAALSSLISEQLGRRGVFLLAAFVFSAGSVVQALSWTYASLLVGILLVGLGVGIGLAIDPLYIAEISPPGGRGFFVTYSEAAIAAGQLLGYIIALIINASLGSCACAWRLMLGLGVVPPACLAYAVIFVMPESPRWLARHGREEEARKVLEDDLQWDATRAQAILEDVRAESAQAPQAGQTWLGLLHLARTKPAVPPRRPFSTRSRVDGVVVDIASTLTPSARRVLFQSHFGERRSRTGEAHAISRRRHGSRTAALGNGCFVLQLREGRRRRRLLAAVEGLRDARRLRHVQITDSFRVDVSARHRGTTASCRSVGLCHHNSTLPPGVGVWLGDGPAGQFGI